MKIIFTWLKLRPREWALSVRRAFNWPDASMDLCQAPDCGVQRKIHGRAHRFVEKAP